jgi:hypothetical protein
MRKSFPKNNILVKNSLLIAGNFSLICYVVVKSFLAYIFFFGGSQYGILYSKQM